MWFLSVRWQGSRRSFDRPEYISWFITRGPADAPLNWWGSAPQLLKKLKLAPLQNLKSIHHAPLASFNFSFCSLIGDPFLILILHHQARLWFFFIQALPNDRFISWLPRPQRARFSFLFLGSQKVPRKYSFVIVGIIFLLKELLIWLKRSLMGDPEI